MRAMMLGLTAVAATCGTTGARAGTACAVSGGQLQCQTATARGVAMTLTFPAATVTQATESAVLCPADHAAVKAVRLYMDMGNGHGHSMDADVAARSDGCTDVLAMDFVMRGAWQVQVTFAGGDTGAIDVDVR